MGTGGAVLACRNVGKAYTSGSRVRHALCDVTLDVEANRFLAVMGPSGSGKSTLLHLLGGLDTPTSGEVLLDGRPLSDLDDRERAAMRRHRVGFVFQAFNLVPVLAAAENVALPGVIAGLPRRQCDDRAHELLGLVGLRHVAGQVPAELSGGEQQRVAIARALFMEPAVLLADEPTGNLDSATGDEVLDVLRHAHRELGQTIVMVTHDERVATAAQDVVVLRDGVIASRRRARPLAAGGR